MSETSPSQTSTAKLEKIHERVEALLDTPVARESDAWALPVDEAVKDTSGPGYAPQADKPAT